MVSIVAELLVLVATVAAFWHSRILFSSRKRLAFSFALVMMDDNILEPSTDNAVDDVSNASFAQRPATNSPSSADSGGVFSAGSATNPSSVHSMLIQPLKTAVTQHRQASSNNLLKWQQAQRTMLS